jgi:JmjC domain, hydroxylase
MSIPALGDVRNNVCTVEIGRFDEVSFDRDKPLVVQGSASRASRKWTEAWSLQQFGDRLCQVSLDSRPAMGSFEQRMPLRSYLDGLKRTDSSGPVPGYLMHSERDGVRACDVLSDLDVPAAISALGRPSLSRFFVGPAYTGTLPHYHTYAINALARGRKRWAIYAGVNRNHTDRILENSYQRYNSGSLAREWFAEECPQLRSKNVQLWEFIQEPGDLVYIPEFMIHAVINLQPVIGFTVEFQPADVLRPPAVGFSGEPAWGKPWSASPPLRAMRRPAPRHRPLGRPALRRRP